MKLVSDLDVRTLVLTHNVKTLTEMRDKFEEYAGYEA